MHNKDSGITLAKKTYGLTLKLLKANRQLLLPFAIFAAADLLALVFVYSIPRMPLRVAFGPIIRSLWGEAFLHYPTNFLLLPKLSALSRMGLTVILGSLTTGAAVIMVQAAYQHKPIHSLKKYFQSTFKKYFSLFIVLLVFTLVFYFADKILTILSYKYFAAGHRHLLFIKAETWVGPILTVIKFLVAALVQASFIYAIPILMIENKPVVKAIAGSFLLFKKYSLATLALVLLPMLLFIPIIILHYNAILLINTFFPEIIFWLTVFSIILNSLVIDTLITISTTLLYLNNSEKK